MSRSRSKNDEFHDLLIPEVDNCKANGHLRMNENENNLPYRCHSQTTQINKPRKED